MIERLFPRQVDNTYRGRPIARWVFIGLTIMTVGRSLVHMFASDGGAQSIATIPLDTFTPNGADAVVLIFALWGLSQLIIGLLYVVVLWRYQALIPLMYLFMIVEYAMRMFLGELKPIETTGTAPGAIGDYIIVPLATVMLILTLWEGRRRTAEAT
ncbi:MAG: hypothetical protein ACOCYT_01105 [Chloroflexota bacterium]